MALNLNDEKIRSDKDEGVALRQYELGLDCSVYFRDVKKRLLKHIASAEYVFGCVAWLTDEDILRALSSKRGVAIVVQKEDFLRPDSPGRALVNKSRLRDLYEAIPGVSRRGFNSGVGGELSMGGDQGVGAVRDRKAAKAFYLEFQQVLALSEPLDWESEYVTPEWRIGT